MRDRMKAYERKTGNASVGRPVKLPDIKSPAAKASASLSAPLSKATTWVAAAQTVPVPAPETATSQTSPASSAAVSLTESQRGRREITVYTDLQFGYDKEQILIAAPGPFLADARRQIRNFVVTAQYPLSSKTNISLSIPYISQTATINTPVGKFRQTGNGVGDIGLFVERRFPEVARGTEVALTLGMLFPTGKDPYRLNSNQLPTGLGFYQPVARARITKLRVPLQFYAAVDYGTSLSRDLNGSRVKLPASYGAELGFYYSISPEFTAQTAVKWSRVSSPFTFETDSNVAYLSQGLSYTAGADTSFHAAVDAGMTEDALDLFLSLSYVRRF